jgi:hypothetical protein
MIEPIPVRLSEAITFVGAFHRHSRPPRGGLFAVGASDGDGLKGVAIVSRPVARMLQDGFTAEVIRCCAQPDAPLGTCSFLYAACWRATRAMGYRRLVTYTLASEGGASLRGAGWTMVAELPPRGPHRAWKGPDRARSWHPTYGQLKLRWEVGG